MFTREDFAFQPLLEKKSKHEEKPIKDLVKQLHYPSNAAVLQATITTPL